MVEHLAIARQGVNAFLHAGSTGVINEDEWRAGRGGRFHHGRNFVRLGFAGGTTHNGEVLGGNV